MYNIAVTGGQIDFINDLRMMRTGVWKSSMLH